MAQDNRKLKGYIAQRQTALIKLSELKKVADLSLTDVDVHANFKCRFKNMDALYQNFEEIHGNIVTLISTQDNPDLEPHNEIYSTFDKDFYHIQAIYSQLFDLKPDVTLDPFSVSKNNIKLPKLELPVFDGNLKEWQTFIDMFDSTIHNNESLAPIDKFNYLLASLKGHPSSIVKCTPLAGSNYLIAYNSLKKKYENTRLIASAHWHSIENTKKIHMSDNLENLRHILDTFNENLAALKNLSFPIEQWDFILFNMLFDRIDSDTQTRFEFECSSKLGNPDYFNILRDFLERQCSAMDNVALSNPISSKNRLDSSKLRNPSYNSNKPLKFKQGASFVVNSTSSNNICQLCNKTHPIYQCNSFLARSPKDRFTLVKTKKWCTNCLGSKHTASTCSSNFLCKKCSLPHHSLLHFDNQETRSEPTFSGNSRIAPNDISNHNEGHTQSQHVRDTAPVNLFSNIKSTILLSTAMIEVSDSHGKYHPVRALLDSASQCSFISTKCCEKLGLSKIDLSIKIRGVGQISSRANHGVVCSIKPRGVVGPVLDIDLIVLPQICCDMPCSNISLDNFAKYSNLKLADPNFNISRPVEMLLGADIFAYIIKGGSSQSSLNEPVAIETIFGWILMGKLSSPPLEINSFLTSCSEAPLENLVKQFWELEQIPSKVISPPEELLADQIYENTVSRNESGRYIVNLPFRGEEPSFEDSKNIALRRFISLERRLLKNSSLYEQYREFMNDYLSSGHMTLISDDLHNQFSYYIPHHCVLKPESSTTKLRVVFDGSSKCANNLSLNDCLLPGRKLQPDIVNILTRFRLHLVCFTADIKQMYRQILVTKHHQNYQRILWRFSDSDPIQTYCLNTVTYGLSCSPYLAIRTIHQLSNENKSHFPTVSHILSNDVFVDDVVSGSSSLEGALGLQKDLIHVLSTGGFELRKWASNNPQLLSHLPLSSLQTRPLLLDDEADATIKILGLQWNPSTDTFSYQVKPLNKPCTKRSILSELARIYDPLGFLTPVVLCVKHLMQDLWTSGIDWDSQPPDTIIRRWSKLKSEFGHLSAIQVPRLIVSKNIISCQLIGFSDASQVGYAASTYVRVIHANNVITSYLICAKSRVAPLKTISIPRLELCGALLLSELICYVSHIFEGTLQFDRIIAFSDSTTVLAWISSSPHTRNCFVSNRVTTIQERVSPSLWYHVASDDNPADPASRGLFPSELLASSLWWAGPPWLQLSYDNWPSSFRNASDNIFFTDEEHRKVVCVTTRDVVNPISDLLNRFSSLLKIERIVCYILRFIHNCRNHTTNLHQNGPLTNIDIERSQSILLKFTQHDAFFHEIDLLRKKKLLPKHFRKLSPFIDEEGVLRVGGRLVYSKLSFEQKHPALLPSTHRFTQLVIEHTHKKFLHPGFQTLHHLLIQRYWILSPKRTIRKVLSRCIRCFRINPSSRQPQMGNLPEVRVSQIKPFFCTGVDYGGPLSITLGRTRGAKVQKAYICLFVCMSTKALHLEVASDLSTDAFLGALRRFIARRGQCQHLYSDQGTNFVGADKQVSEAMQQATETEGITFHRIPPLSPNWGGLWEAGIKSVKSHLLRVTGDQLLTYEELSTTLCQIESVLNSRPIGPISSDPNDCTALTPGHFLTLAPLNALPDPDLTEIKLSRLSRWQLVQRLHQDFWTRWHREYLHTLLQRSKWTDPSVPIETGALVLLKDDHAPPLKWHMGRVLEVHPGADAIIRVVTVKTTKGIFKRPVTKLCPLPN